ncbi:MAG: pantoate--beta-alanine ligase [Desulfobulbaceae bacterium]|nr:pantoate--beta-alanine ligase [Desulfobulbaceae bacterium]
MKVIRVPGEMTAWAKEQAANGKNIGLVPTMGFFHEGHLSLMRMARTHAERVIVSLFVNPLQFGPNEDLAAYPRDFERDGRLAEQEGVDVLFAPSVDDMYPDGFQTTVSVSTITGHLCGANRPGHFDGVATVLTKLFHVTGADCAVFGEKDYQQLAVIRRMVTDLNADIEIIGHPIVRHKDGLAMSSRNAYLDAAERETALCLSGSIALARSKAEAGMTDTGELTRLVRDFILSFRGTEIDYASFVDCRTLEPAGRLDDNTLLALAVKINGRVRLIDNGLVLEDNESADEGWAE